MSPLRVAVVAPPWRPLAGPVHAVDTDPVPGIVAGLATGLRAAGHEVLAFATGDSTLPVDVRWVLPRAETVTPGATVPELRHVIAAHEAARAWEADVVHDFTVAGPLYADRFPGHTVVATVPVPLSPEVADVYGPVAGDVPLVACSQAHRDMAPELPVARVVGAGIDAGTVAVGDGAGGYVVHADGLAPGRGAREAALAARRAGMRLLLVGAPGDAPTRRAFTELVGPLLDDLVTHVGDLAGDALLEVLGGAAALVHTATWPRVAEPVVLAALACGTPVVALREAPGAECVEHGATGYVALDPGGLTGALGSVDLLDRSACRGVAESRWGTARMVAEYAELYGEVAG